MVDVVVNPTVEMQIREENHESVGVNENTLIDVMNVVVLDGDGAASSHFFTDEASTARKGKKSKPQIEKKARQPRKKKMSVEDLARIESERSTEQGDLQVDSQESSGIPDPATGTSVAVEVPPPLIEVRNQAVISPSNFSQVLIGKQIPKSATAVAKSLVLPAQVQDKIDYYKMKACALVDELDILHSKTVGFETDRDMNLQSVVSEAVNLLCKCLTDNTEQKNTEVEMDNDTSALVSNPSEAAANALCAVLSEPIDPLLASLTKVVYCIVQGSTDPLSQVVTRVRETLSNVMHQALEAIKNSTADKDEGAWNPKLSDISSLLLTRFPDSRVLQGIFNPESHIIGDEVKGAAIRECYGIRSRDAITFENSDVMSIWCWEVIKTSSFSSSEFTIVKECQSNRRRYGRAVKSFMATVEHLEKSASLDDSKVQDAEAKASKAVAEVERAKQKRLEIEHKKMADRAEKAKREELKEQKLREKEEQLKKKKEDAAREAAMVAEKKRENEARVAEEKAAIAAEKKLEEEKLAKKLEKQRNMMQNFLLSKSARNSSSTAFEKSDVSTSNGLDFTESAHSKKRLFDGDTFEKTVIRGSLPRNEVLRMHRERYSEEAKVLPKKKKRKVVIQVPVEVAGDAFGADTYTELVDKTIDGKMKLFQFHEYERTRYWGTISKRSSIVNGRTFFKKDESLRNYDIDSAEEWEDDEEVGEDIIDSEDDNDGEEPNEPNELVYDDFFRHDDDFGSDVDEETGECRRPIVPRATIVGKSVAGPRFIYSSPVQHDVRMKGESISPLNNIIKDSVCTHVAFNLDGCGNIINCEDSDKDVDRLLPFYTVVYPAVVDGGSFLLSSAPTGETVPTIGAAESAIDNANVDKTKALSLDQSRVFASFVHGKKWGLDKLVDALKVDFPELSKNFIRRNISEIALKEKGTDGVGSLRWVIKTEIISNLQLELPGLDYTPQKKKRITPILTMAPTSTLFPTPSVADISQGAGGEITAPQIVSPPVLPCESSNVAVKEPAIEQPIAVSVAKPKTSKKVTTVKLVGPKATITSFFENPKSATKSTSGSSETLLDASMGAEILSPDRSLVVNCQDGGSPLDFDVFDRLVGTPSATPYVKKRPDQTKEIPHSTELFGQDNDDDVMLLDMSSP